MIKFFEGLFFKQILMLKWVLETNRINITEKYKDLVNKLKFIHYNDEVTSFRPMKIAVK